MPRGYCLYPQDTTVDEFLDDGKTPNPQRCPYRTHWDPYVTPAPASRLCCKKTVVKQKLRYDPNNKDIPATHVNFTDERPPRPHLPPNPRGCASQDEVACRKNKRCRYLDEDKEPVLLFTNEWSVRQLEDRNKDIVLGETSFSNLEDEE